MTALVALVLTFSTGEQQAIGFGIDEAAAKRDALRMAGGDRKSAALVDVYERYVLGSGQVRVVPCSIEDAKYIADREGRAWWPPGSAPIPMLETSSCVTLSASTRLCPQCNACALAYPGAVYCGAACSAAAEMHVPPTFPPTYTFTAKVP
jgi:hypothetical protein